MNNTTFIEPIDNRDLFTRKSISEHILEVTTPTFNNYLKSGKIYPPRYVSGTSTSSNPRMYYSLADAMRISIIIHGSVQMEKIRALLSSSNHDCAADNTLDYIKQSFQAVKNQITTGSIDPIDLKPYLQD